VFLLVGISALATTWDTTPTFRNIVGLGGSDVEIFEGEYGPSPTDDVLVKPNPFADSRFSVAPANSHPDSEGALYAPPRSPVVSDGAAGRGVTTYVVENGDVLGEIAESFRVSMFALAYSNNIVDPDSIQPGDKLRVPPEDGVLHVVKKNETLGGIAKKYKAETAEILAFNGLPADGSELTVGYEIVVPNGTPPAPPKPKYVPRYSGPKYATNRVPLGYYIAPTTGLNYGRRHSNNGVDIANSCGTPIYAAAAGNVTLAKYGNYSWRSNGGYGTYLMIKHGNGTTTLYAHNSQLIVGKDDYVAQGQLIALMGTTGRSTGCHVHFEVRGATNPMVR